MNGITDPIKRDHWTRLRFAIIGPLLAAPPAPGALPSAVRLLAAKTWHHPITGLDVAFGVSTLERWFYTARRAGDSVAMLKDRIRGDVGRFPSMTPLVIDTLMIQYREHPGWTIQLHVDNLRAVPKDSDTAIASYPSIRRYLKAQGMFR